MEQASNTNSLISKEGGEAKTAEAINYLLEYCFSGADQPTEGECRNGVEYRYLRGHTTIIEQSEEGTAEEGLSVMVRLRKYVNPPSITDKARIGSIKLRLLEGKPSTFNLEYDHTSGSYVLMREVREPRAKKYSWVEPYAKGYLLRELPATKDETEIIYNCLTAFKAYE